jgi:BirA family biotin operon repressor/biotin-[acetyl-CoA-carboxylase] ligase
VYLSALAKPSLRLREALWISLATGLAAQAAVRSSTGLQAEIRWPNDLLLGGKKLGGILVETAIEPDAHATLRYAVIGIGINVHHTAFPAELQQLATSLDRERKADLPVHRTALAGALLVALDHEMRRLEGLEHDRQGLLQRFAERSTWVRGKHVHVAERGGYTGTTDGLDAEGFLLVITGDGTVHTVLSGGVREATERCAEPLKVKGTHHAAGS